MTNTAFEIEAITDLAGVQYNKDVDYTDGDDGRSWRVYTTTEQAHSAVARQRARCPTVRAVDCSDILDKVDREDGGLFGCWIVTLRA